MLGETGHLLSCSLDGTLKVWDYTRGTCLIEFEHAAEFRCLAYRCAPDILRSSINIIYTIYYIVHTSEAVLYWSLQSRCAPQPERTRAAGLDTDTIGLTVKTSFRWGVGLDTDTVGLT
eukprot:2211064-Pyramimonas_sp.AAC.1